MSQTKETAAERTDALMEQASRALVGRDYFRTERLCLEALDIAHAGYDYARMAAILLPLQESRRFKRHMALDAGHVTVISREMPAPNDLCAGCFLVCPPRVGLDGRQLREMCDRGEVPALILTREPATRSGLWPIVALGPATIRATVPPPPPPRKKKSAKGDRANITTVTIDPGDPASPYLAAWAAEAAGSAPTVEWFVSASEALGDAAIAQIDPSRPAAVRVEELFMRLAAFPDHEKLHQRLHDACAEAARIGKPPPGKVRPEDVLGELDETDEDSTEV